MIFNNLFDAMTWLNSSGWLKDESIMFHPRDYYSGLGKISVFVKNHEFSIDSIKLDDGYHIFTVEEISRNRFMVSCNQQKLKLSDIKNIKKFGSLMAEGE